MSVSMAEARCPAVGVDELEHSAPDHEGDDGDNAEECPPGDSAALPIAGRCAARHGVSGPPQGRAHGRRALTVAMTWLRSLAVTGAMTSAASRPSGAITNVVGGARTP